MCDDTATGMMGLCGTTTAGEGMSVGCTGTIAGRATGTTETG